jgi:hypothetical protein
VPQAVQTCGASVKLNFKQHKSTTVIVYCAGGDLQLVNLPGYGVDAFLTLRRLDTAGWHEQHDDDVAAAGQAAAISAAVKVQQQLAQAREPARVPL